MSHQFREIEDLLLNAVRMEPIDEVKISTLTAMSAAGYQSGEISDRALETFKSTQDSHAQRRARKLLGSLKDDRLLSDLIIIAKGDNPSLSKGALLAIAGYGESGPALLKYLFNRMQAKRASSLRALRLPRTGRTNRPCQEVQNHIIVVLDVPVLNFYKKTY